LSAVATPGLVQGCLSCGLMRVKYYQFDSYKDLPIARKKAF
jgi:hypothetical protein